MILRIFANSPSANDLFGGTNQRYREDSKWVPDWALTGDPPFGPLVFSTINNSAFLAAGHEFKDDFLASIQAGLAVVFRCGKEQPVASNNLVCPALGQDLIASIRIQLN